MRKLCPETVNGCTTIRAPGRACRRRDSGRRSELNGKVPRPLWAGHFRFRRPPAWEGSAGGRPGNVSRDLAALDRHSRHRHARILKRLVCSPEVTRQMDRPSGPALDDTTRPGTGCCTPGAPCLIGIANIGIFFMGRSAQVKSLRSACDRWDSHATVEHAFESQTGRFGRGSPARTLPSRPPAAPARHPRRLVAVRLHARRAWAPHLHLSLPRRRSRVRTGAQLPALPGSERRADVMGLGQPEAGDAGCEDPAGG